MSRSVTTHGIYHSSEACMHGVFFLAIFFFFRKKTLYTDGIFSVTTFSMCMTTHCFTFDVEWDLSRLRFANASNGKKRNRFKNQITSLHWTLIRWTSIPSTFLKLWKLFFDMKRDKKCIRCENIPFHIELCAKCWLTALIHHIQINSDNNMSFCVFQNT